MSTRAIRQALVAAGAGRAFSLKPLPAAELTEQLTRFVPLLFRAAGYAGWCILLDEIELIGRYTPLQRALSYAWLAAWLGLDDASAVSAASSSPMPSPTTSRPPSSTPVSTARSCQIG